MTELKSDMIIPKIDGKYDLQALQEHFMKGGVIETASLKSMILECAELLRKEPNLIEVDGNCLIFGDFHGQYFDFLSELSDSEWDKCEHTKVFLGDYVDRGEFSCEILITLICMKLNNPDETVLLRGNHESRAMTQRFGFKTEVSWKYDLDIYDMFCDLFDTIPIGVLLDCSLGSFLLCHGGISPKITDLNDILDINRFRDPPHSGLFCDLLWSDPVGESFFMENPKALQQWDNITYLPNDSRNCSFIYGYQAIQRFFELTDVRAVVRGHQCVPNGIELHNFGDDDAESPYAFTLFSAPNYSEGNKGAGMMISDSGINVRTYGSSDLANDFQPLLVNGLIQGLRTLVKEINGMWDYFLEYAFDTYDPEDEEDDGLDMANLAAICNAYEEQERQKKEKRERELREREQRERERKLRAAAGEVEEEESEDDDVPAFSLGASVPQKQVQRQPQKSALRRPLNKMTTKRRGGALSQSIQDVRANQQRKKSALLQSIATDQPTKFEKKKRIRAESAPQSIDDLRKKWEEAREKHLKGGK